MNLQRPRLEQPYMFWLIQELFSGDQGVEEEMEPISNQEFYVCMGMIAGALLLCAVVFRIIGA